MEVFPSQSPSRSDTICLRSATQGSQERHANVYLKIPSGETHPAKANQVLSSVPRQAPGRFSHLCRVDAVSRHRARVDVFPKQLAGCPHKGSLSTNAIVM